MSFNPTSFRPVARGGWGGRAASHFRGILALGQPDAELPIEDPQVLVPSRYGQIGSAFIRHYAATVNRLISGVTRNGTGVALGNCRVELFQTGGDIPTTTTTSPCAISRSMPRSAWKAP